MNREYAGEKPARFIMEKLVYDMLSIFAYETCRFFLLVFDMRRS